MSYEKQTWNKYDDLKTEEENIANGAVVTENRMNHIEEGIYSHTIDISNPHKVTAAQVGLDKVINVKQASKVEFDSHVNNKANPHAVTASQVGAYTKTESDSKLTDLSNKVIANKGNLASGTDLDNVIDIGTYRIGGLTGGTDIINVPSERSGTTIYAYLTVSGTTTSVVQELIVYDSKTGSKIYSRSRYGSTTTFNPWSKTVMADDSGEVKVNDLTVNGDMTVTTNSATGISIGNGLTADFFRKGEIVFVKWGGILTATKQGVAFSGEAPTDFRPTIGTSLLGHFAGTDRNFHIDLNSSGNFTWWGATTTGTLTPRGVATYLIQ